MNAKQSRRPLLSATRVTASHTCIMRSAARFLSAFRAGTGSTLDFGFDFDFDFDFEALRSSFVPVLAAFCLAASFFMLARLRGRSVGCMAPTVSPARSSRMDSTSHTTPLPPGLSALTKLNKTEYSEPVSGLTR